MMLKPTKRKAFNFLRSYYDVLNELENDKDKLDFLIAIIDKQFLNEDPKELNFIVNLCYKSQMHAIDSSVKGWMRVAKTDLTGNPMTDMPTTPPTNPPTNPKEVEEEVEEKEKVKVVTIEDRKLKFAESLNPFLDQYGKDILNQFYFYWTESNPNAKKFKKELEKTFDIALRLKRWKNNNFNIKTNSNDKLKEQADKGRASGIRF